MKDYLEKQKIIELLKKKIQDIKDNAIEETEEFVKEVVNTENPNELVKLCTEFKQQNEHEVEEIQIIEDTISELNEIKAVKRK